MDNGLTINLLGPLRMARAGQELKAPASRKTRALLGYLILAPRPVTRQRLCDLLFDVPDDPRAALRWSLSKLRPLVDDRHAPRLLAERDQMRFVAADAQIDVMLLQSRASGDLAAHGDDELRLLLQQCRGALLEDAELPDRPEYSAWLAAVRADFRAIEKRLVTALLGRATLSPGEASALWQRRVDLDPFDEQAYAGLTRALRALGRAPEADAVMHSGVRALRAAGLKPSLLLHSRPDLLHAKAPEAVGTQQRSGPPVVAVLPFRDLSRETLPAYVVDGLLEGIVHELSRFRSLEVLARQSTEGLRDHVAEPVALGQRLGADVLVGGSVAADSASVKIRWRIAETRNGRLIASGDEVHSLDDALGLSNDVAVRIAVAIEPRAQAEALERSVQRQPTTWAAYDHYLRGLYGAFSPNSNVDYPAALQSFRAALKADPSFAPAAAFLPWAAIAGNLIATPQQLEEYVACARLAVRNAGDDARTLAIGGSALLFLTGDFATALESVERALRLNPNEYSAWIQAGWVFIVGGEYERPMDCFARAERLNSSGVAEVTCRSMRAYCHYFHGQLQPAEALIARSIIDLPSNFWNWVIATAIAVERDDMHTARVRAAQIKAMAHDGLRSVQLAAIPWRQPAYLERVRIALRAAGVPS
jgi:DNA-binding SARP family transcriptional activator/TolB-like protein